MNTVQKGKEDIPKRFESQGAATVSMTSAEFGKSIQAETVKWAQVVTEAAIRAE